MGITHTNQCGLCQNSEETLFHLFTECNITNAFWADLVQEINDKCNLALTLDTITKLFGYQNTTSFAQSINTILILMRYYIFIKCKTQGSLFMIEFKRLLKRVYSEQELLSRLDNKNEVFNKKWDKLLNII